MFGRKTGKSKEQKEELQHAIRQAERLRDEAEAELRDVSLYQVISGNTTAVRKQANHWALKGWHIIKMSTNAQDGSTSLTVVMENRDWTPSAQSEAQEKANEAGHNLRELRRRAQ